MNSGVGKTISFTTGVTTGFATGFATFFFTGVVTCFTMIVSYLSPFLTVFVWPCIGICKHITMIKDSVVKIKFFFISIFFLKQFQMTRILVPDKLKIEES